MSIEPTRVESITDRASLMAGPDQERLLRTLADHYADVIGAMVRESIAGGPPYGSAQSLRNGANGPLAGNDRELGKLVRQQIATLTNLMAGR